MSEMREPNIAKDLVRIHKVVTRGLNVSIERGQTFLRDGYPDAATREGYMRYIQGLAGVLEGHHLSEDEVAFPFFREKRLKAPYDRLAADHEQIQSILGEMQKATGEKGEPALGDLVGALVKVKAVWGPHILKEETHFTQEKLKAVVDPAEEGVMSGRIAKHSAEHGKPDYLVMPFVLYNLSAQDRAELAGMLPPVVTEQLVPHVWKEQWAPMKPFLLE